MSENAPARKAPKNATFYEWEKFCRWADQNGIGEHPDDWNAWWECWVAAFSAAMNT